MLPAIADHLWHCTLFALIAASITVWLRQHAAKARYWVWFAASVKFLLPFSVLIGMGAQIASMRARTPTGATALASPAVTRIVQPFAPEATAVIRSTPAAERDGAGTALAAVWICGVFVIVRRRWLQWRTIRSALRASREAPIRAGIAVRYGPDALEPAVVGWRRPVLLLPDGIADALSAAQLQAVVVHELCHVRRRDNPLALLHMVVEVLFWFHPMVWWIGLRLVVEREHACDEEVLRAGVEPRVYAQGILAVCRRYAHSPLTAVSGVTSRILKRRIEAIMINRTSRPWSSRQTAGLLAVAAAVLALPFLTGVVNAPLLRAQAAPALRFDSVTIERCGDLSGTRRGGGYAVSGGVLNTGCLPLADEQGIGLIQRAYVRFGEGGRVAWPSVIRVKGRPSWFDSEFYTVTGKAAPDTAAATLEGPMLRAALEDHFRLRIHEDAAAVPVYALGAVPGGPEAPEFVEGSCVAPQALFPSQQPPGGQRYCALRVSVQPPAVDAEGATLNELAQLLSLVLDRPVVDGTHLTRRYRLHLEFTPDASTPRFLAGGDLARFATTPAPGTPPIGQALRQAGLRLDAVEGNLRQLVIDQVEKPR